MPHAEFGEMELVETSLLGPGMRDLGLYPRDLGLGRQPLGAWWIAAGVRAASRMYPGDDVGARAELPSYGQDSIARAAREAGDELLS